LKQGREGHGRNFSFFLTCPHHAPFPMGVSRGTTGQKNQGLFIFFIVCMIQDLRRTFVIASAAKQSRNAANGKTGLPRLLRRLAMTMCVSPMINISDKTKEPDDE
jgi:hypothetical protein